MPKNPTLDNFDTVLTEQYRGKFFAGNQSSAHALHPQQRRHRPIAGTLFALIIGTLAAYGISRFTLRAATSPGTSLWDGYCY